MSNQFSNGPFAISQQTSIKKTPASKPFGCTGTNKLAKKPLGADFQPSLYSVICARGQSSFNHAGNRRFRALTTLYLERYSRATAKAAKSAIVSNIVATVRQAGGDFCKIENHEWFEVGDHCAREKVSTLLRDLLHTQYRSSGKAKSSNRRNLKLKLKKKQDQQHEQQQQQFFTQFSPVRPLINDSPVKIHHSPVIPVDLTKDVTVISLSPVLLVDTHSPPATTGWMSNLLGLAIMAGLATDTTTR
jgi:hypothetical protein